MLTIEQARQVRHLLAHAARILLFTAAHPELPNRAEYDEQMTIYRAQWATVPLDERRGIAAQLIADERLGDLTQDAIDTAVAALES